MRKTTFCQQAAAILICCCCFFLPQRTAAQDRDIKTVSISVRNASLDEILQRIAKLASVKMVYNNEQIGKVARRDFSVKSATVSTTLEKLLEGTGFSFTIRKNTVVITPKENKHSNEKVESIRYEGLITDQQGAPLALATISRAGSDYSTLSDQSGKFSIEIPRGSSLLFSYIGMKTQTLLPKEGEPIRIRLAPEPTESEQVVITGYQKIDRRLSASSTYTLKGEEVKEPNVTNVAGMLQGKVPGMSVINNSGSVNAVPKIRIRGTSTLIGNANPIWVVDGIIREDPDEVIQDNLLQSNDMKANLLTSGGVLSKAALMGNSINGINPNDIESITVLKDASATAIYGTRAANGVIVITTKRGKAGRSTVNYNFVTSLTQKPSYGMLSLMDSKQRIRLSKEIFEDGLVYPGAPSRLSYESVRISLMEGKISQEEYDKEVARLETMNTDWFDLLFQNGISNTHSLSLSGGAEKMGYYASINYGDSKGTANEDWKKNFSGMVSINAELSKRVKVDMKLDGTHSISNGYYDVNPMDYALKTSRAIDPDEYYPLVQKNPKGVPYTYNFKNEIAESGSKTRQYAFNGNLNIRVKLMRGLEFASLAGAGISTQESRQFSSEKTYPSSVYRGYNYGSVAAGSTDELQSPMPFGGMLFTSNVSNINFTFRNTLNYNLQLFGGRDDLNVMAGHEVRSNKYRGYSELLPGYLPDRGEGITLNANSYFLMSPSITNTVANGTSLFATATYSFLGKYVLNGNIRNDASNRFGQYSNSKFLPVWSVAARWNLINEPWMEKVTFFDDLNIKASVGFQGNAVTSVGPDMVAVVPSFNIVHPLVRQYQLTLKNLAYPDLRWEKTRSVNLELNATMFNARLNLMVAGYWKTGRDIITSLDAPVEYGSQKMIMNGGIISNKGYEMVANVHILKLKNLQWNMSVNVAKNFNTLRKGSDVTAWLVQDYLSGRAEVPGAPMGTFYVLGFKGLDPGNGMPMFNMVDDGLTVEQRKVMTNDQFLVRAGKSEPDIAGGLNTRIGYKAFSLNMQFAFSVGASKLRNPVFGTSASTDPLVPMPDKNALAIMEKRWRKPGDEQFTNIPSYPSSRPNVIVGNGNSNFGRYYLYDHSDLLLLPADFIRCRSMALSYMLPEFFVSKAGFSAASVSLQASNLFIITDTRWKGQDPEVMGAGTTALPITASYSLSINVTL